MSWQGKYLEAGSIVQRHQDVVFKRDVCVAYLFLVKQACPYNGWLAFSCVNKKYLRSMFKTEGATMQPCRGSYITAFSEEGPWGLKAQSKTPVKLPHRREPHTYSCMFLVINLHIPNTSNHRHYEARRVFYESSWLFDSLKTRPSSLVVLVETNCLIIFKF